MFTPFRFYWVPLQNAGPCVEFIVCGHEQDEERYRAGCQQASDINNQFSRIIAAHWPQETVAEVTAQIIKEEAGE